jgi:large subunit ribosomal protein L2
MVDFALDKKDILARVETIEYDPYRTGFIALVCYRDGERRYVLAHSEMKVGDDTIISATAKPIPGNRMEIGNIPTGLTVYNVDRTRCFYDSLCWIKCIGALTRR